jgi:hypothetical protein
LANIYKINRILTIDQRDFSIYRLDYGGTFDRLWLQPKPSIAANYLSGEIN